MAVVSAEVNGNVFLLLSRTAEVLRDEGFSNEDVNVFWNDADDLNYNEVLDYVMEWVDVE